MQLVYLPSTVEDFEWFKRYYSEVFPQGLASAQKQFFAIETLLKENPNIGRKTDFKSVRELGITRTPFSIIYRVKTNRIEVLRIWDNRRDRSNL